MGVYDKYYNQVRKSQEKSLAEDVAATEKMHDTQKQTVEENYNTQISDTEVSYEDAFKSNDVQRQLNERYLERKAAELGLTDSGMSRTQQTAVQLSHVNQRGSLNAQKQKAIDTLAQTMRAKIVEIENSKTASVQQIKSSYDNEARTQATSMTNSYNASQASMYNARLAAENEKAKAWNAEYNKLLTGIIDSETNTEVKKRAIEAFGDTYGFESIEQANAALKYAGLVSEYAGLKYIEDPDNPGKLKLTSFW